MLWKKKKAYKSEEMDVIPLILVQCLTCGVTSSLSLKRKPWGVQTPVTREHLEPRGYAKLASAEHRASGRAS